MDDKKTNDSAEEKKQTIKNKVNSRKFIIVIYWAFLVLILLIIGFIRENDETIKKALEYFFYISIGYFGGNVLTKKITADENKADK